MSSVVDRGWLCGSRMERALLAGCVYLAGCREGGRDLPSDSARAVAPGVAACAVPAAARDSAPRALFALQLAAFADSARAARLRDSLAAEGWGAYVREGGGAARWRVRVAPSADARVTRRVAVALAAGGRVSTFVRDTVPADSVAAALALHPVGGSAGMSAEVLWAHSPDRCALLAVHDPTAVENEPVPDAFLYVREGGGPPVGYERVWDVAPSPDWRRLAYSRAWVLPGRERDSLDTAEWEAVAREMGTSAAAARAAAFPASGMAVAFGLAQPVVVNLTGAGGAPASAARPLATLGGWRLRWVDERTLALGAPPASTMDDAPSTRWVLVDPESGRPLPGAVRALPDDSGAAGGTRWERGPTVDISVPVDTGARRVEIPGARVESRGGWVRVTPTARQGRSRARVVGPGVALAATAGGRFILALAPKLQRREYEAHMELVVYEVAP